MRLSFLFVLFLARGAAAQDGIIAERDTVGYAPARYSTATRAWTPPGSGCTAGAGVA